MLVGQHAIIDLNFSHLEGASVFTKQFKDIIEGILSWASVVAQTVKNPPAMQETWVSSLGWEDPLKEVMATHFSILAWRIPWTEESGSLQSMGLQRVGHDLAHPQEEERIGQTLDSKT